MLTLPPPLYIYIITFIQATKTAVEMDNLLLSKFTIAVNEIVCDAASPSKQVIDDVHSKLLWKVYNTRCNEFLQALNKLSCLEKNKSVDADVGLRDMLKVYAIKKVSEF